MHIKLNTEISIDNEKTISALEHKYLMLCKGTNDFINAFPTFEKWLEYRLSRSNVFQQLVQDNVDRFIGECFPYTV